MASLVGDLVLDDSVTSLANYAFKYCSELTSVTIPSSVTTIGTDVFSNCSNLTSIIIEKPENPISGAPWGATGVTPTWTGQ